MSNLDTRLRETLDRVAESTKVHRRVDEIVHVRQRRSIPKFAVGLAAFAAVVAIFALPMFLVGSPGNDVASSLSAPADTGLTVDPAWLTVDPEDVAAYNEIPLPGNGERAPLKSETIWCFYEDARPVEAHVAGIGVDEPLTAETLTATCATETDSAAETESTQESMTVCRGVFDSPNYQDWASSGEMTLVSGDIAGSKPGFPVILGWRSDCISESLASNPTVTLTADLSLEAVNQARQLELAVIGAADQNCLSYDQSQALAAAVVAELGQEWMHASRTGAEQLTGACYQPFIDQQWGWVVSDIIRGEQAPQVTESTVAPTGP